MEKLGAFFAAHPESQTAVQATLGGQPLASFATAPYYSPHTFFLVDAAGERHPARYRWLPEAGEASLDDEEARAKPRDYLREELEQRLAAGPVAFGLQAKIAGEGDDPNDPAVAWPEEREKVLLGRLEIAGLDTTRERDGDVLVFDATRVTPGIELSDDRILAARPGAYSVSVARRTT
jgi:catalase